MSSKDNNLSYICIAFKKQNIYVEILLEAFRITAGLNNRKTNITSIYIQKVGACLIVQSWSSPSVADSYLKF